MAEDGKIKVDKFDVHNSGFWKMQIEDYLYQEKLREPLAEAKLTSMKAEDWTLLDRQALGAVRLSLAKNVAYNVVDEKTTYMKEGAPVADHVNEFNSFLSRLMLVDIKFDDEVQALLLPSSLPESTVTTGQKARQWAEVEQRDKEVNLAARDYDDALVCCVENTIVDCIMDSSASFHATYCKEELEKFKLRSGKFRLADDKTIDIAGVGDVVLKTYFGRSWTLKDVRYIPGLMKRLISVVKLDEEGYHIGFRVQQLKVTKGSLVVAHGNKRGSLYMVEVASDEINTAIDGRCNATLWNQRLGHMSEKCMKILALKGRIPDLQNVVVGFCDLCVLRKQKKASFVKSKNTRKLQRLELVHTDVYGPTTVASIGGSCYYVTFMDNNSRKNSVAGRMNRTLNERAKKKEWQGKEVSLAHLRIFRYDSYVKVKDVARDKLDAKSMKDVTFNEDSLYGAKAAPDSSNLTKPNQKDQMVLEDSPENLENKSIVAEHGVSSEITQSPGGSTYTSEGSENNRSFEDSGRSDEEDSKDIASSETSQVRRSTKESKALVRDKFTDSSAETLHEMDSKSALSVIKIQQCKVQEVQSSVTSSGDETSSRIVSDEEIEKKNMEAHYGFMAKIQEVLPAESSSIDTPLEQAPFLNVQKTFDRSRSSLGLHVDDVCSHQFRPRSSSNDF
ncbi:hypothetical protein Tco_0950040 [Tanacetum coccineum]